MYRENESILGREEAPLPLSNVEVKEDIAVNVKICGRIYPMRVKASDEGRIREAGKKINEQIEKYRTNFGIDDQQDLLAMVAFDCLVSTDASTPQESTGVPAQFLGKIEDLTQLIDQTLKS